MNILKTFSPILVFLSLSAFVNAQALSATAVREDLSLLKEKILEFNPAVDLYTPAFEELADELIQSVDDSMSIFASFALCSKMCQLANEGHFEMGTWTDPVHRRIRNDIAPFFPIAVYIIDEMIYVRGDFSNEGYLSPGDRILSINGMPDHMILDHLRQFVPSDGYIQTYADKQIAGSFPWLYYFYVEQAREYEIQFMSRKDQEVKTKLTYPLTRAQRKANAMRRYTIPPPKEKSKKDLYNMEFLDTVGILTLKSFDYKLVEEFDVKAGKLYKAIFKRCAERGIRHLVIDLRNNKGGRLEFGEEIVPYILKDDQGHDFLVTSLSWKGRLRKERMPSPSSHVFDGEIYALVNGHTYSTAATIARYLREYGDARIIGEEGGTRYEGFVAGSAQYVQLPNSEIRFGIPCYHKEFAESEKQQTENRGIIPDYRVSPDIDDILNGEDVVMEYVLSMIKYGR